LKKHSLKRALLVAVGLSLGISLLVSAAWVFYETNHEVEELFDAELAQHGRVIDAIFSWNVLQHGSPDPDAESVVVDVDYDAPTVVHSQLGEIFVGHHYEKKIAFRVTDLKGKALYHSHNFPNQIAAILTPGFHSFEIEGNSWHLFSIQSRLSSIRVEVMQEQSIRRELSTDVSLGTLLPLQIMLPLILVLVLLIVQLYFRPLSTLSRQLQSRSAASFEKISHEKTPAEILPLVDTVNSLLDRMRQSFEREKRFTADAAHELRNALAVLKAGSQTMDDSEQAAFNLGRSVDRMTHLVEQLLQLNRVDADLDPGMGDVPIPALIRAQIAELYDGMLTRGVQIHFDSKDDVVLQGNPLLLEVLIHNLLGNAAKYAAPDTEISVVLDSSTLSINNFVEPGHQMLVERLEDRFYRGQNPGAIGAGLGLGIVQLIAERHHLAVNYQCLDDNFIVQLNW